MIESFRRLLSSGALALLLGLALLVLLAVHEGVGSWFGFSSDYATRMQQLAGADRSQALHMQLEAQYPGPLQDTVIERWRDPVDGTVCYIYLPIAVAHQPGPPGLMQYGSAAIGSISCLSTRH
jgi:hypothetical protein